MYLRFFQSINEVKWSSQINGTGDLSSILRLFNLFDCYVIKTSQLTKRFVHNITFNSFLFDWRIQNDVNCFCLQYLRELHPFPAFNGADMLHGRYVTALWLSVNFGTDVARSGTRDAWRQFRDCPGHYRTVGNPSYLRLFCATLFDRQAAITCLCKIAYPLQ